MSYPLAWRAAHEAFGAAELDAGNDVTFNVRFPGQYYDAETERWDPTLNGGTGGVVVGSGLHYNRHRYFDPSTGRYVSADPIGQFGLALAQFSIPSGSRGDVGFDGVDANLYAYVWNAPTVFIDPLGLYRCAPGADCTFSPMLSDSIECLEKCLHENGREDAELTVTSGRRGQGTTNHNTGHAADFGENTNPGICRPDFEDCFTKCFPAGGYGQHEENAPEEPGFHYHVQTNEGRGRTHPPFFAPGTKPHTNHDR